MNNLEDGQTIAVIELARELGRRKQHLFKVMRRMGIEGIKKRSSDARGQLITHISQEDAGRIRDSLVPPSEDIASPEVLTGIGVFYVIQLEPKMDPNRLKLGFASDLNERLRKHKTAAPFAVVLRSWPCKPLWEKTAIDCISTSCERLREEVFRARDVQEVTTRGDRFFELMPLLNE